MCLSLPSLQPVMSSLHPLLVQKTPINQWKSPLETRSADQLVSFKSKTKTAQDSRPRSLAVRDTRFRCQDLSFWQPTPMQRNSNDQWKSPVLQTRSGLAKAKTHSRPRSLAVPHARHELPVKRKHSSSYTSKWCSTKSAKLTRHHKFEISSHNYSQGK